MKVERDYSHIKAKVWRERSGFLCCELSGIRGVFILLMVSSNQDETVPDLVQTALNCLSMKDLALAAGKAG